MSARSMSMSPEQTRAVAAGSMLALVLMAHAMLETARDALFLASLPATRLPFVYLGVAFVSVLVMRALDAWGPSRKTRIPGVLPVGFAAAGTLVMWAWLAFLGDTGLYALYIWTGTAITVVLVRLWLNISAVFTVSQARRFYSAIRTGSVIGAIVGSAFASLFSHFTHAPAGLLPLSALTLCLAIIPARYLGRPDDDPQAHKRKRPSLKGDVKALKNPYARHILAIGLLATVTLTLGDYLFKATLAEAVPAGSLGSIFGIVYFTTNVAGLLVQVGVAKLVIDRVGPAGAVVALPLAAFLGGVGMIGLAGITGAIIYKALEGPLRHTVDRTATEMLFVPMLASTRERVKSIADTVVKRGGQALGSVVILGSLLFGLEGRQIGIVMLVLGAVWIGVAITLRGPYLAVFRRSLHIGSAGRVPMPTMEIDSLSAVLAALNSPRDADVLAALDLLAGDDRLEVVPTLLLYHPSPEVVRRAARLLADDGRRELLPLAERLLGASSPTVHGAVLLAVARVKMPDVARLKQLHRSDCPATRAVAGALLIHLDKLDADAVGPFIAETLASESVVARAAFASAIAHFPHPLLDPALMTLAREAETEVAGAALEGIARRRDIRFLPAVLERLADMHTASKARDAIRSLPAGDVYDVLNAIHDPNTPAEARWELPSLVVGVHPEAAAQALLRALPKTQGSEQHLSMLRALALATSQDRGFTFVEARVVQAEEDASAFAVETLAVLHNAENLSFPPGCETLHRLLVDMLRGLHRRACEQLILLQCLRLPGERLLSLWPGLQASSSDTRDASLELLRSLATGPNRELILTLMDGEEEQLDALLMSAEYDWSSGLLERLEHADDDAVRSLATALRRTADLASLPKGA